MGNVIRGHLRAGSCGVDSPDDIVVLQLDDTFLQLFSIGRQHRGEGLVNDEIGNFLILIRDIYKLEECFKMLQRVALLEDAVERMNRILGNEYPHTRMFSK
jgi:hypothetical protein